MGTLQIYALLTRAPLFHGIGHKALIGCAVNMAGYVPPAWQAWWDSNDHSSLTDESETYWLQSREYIREGCSDDEDTDAAISLLQRILHVETVCATFVRGDFAGSVVLGCLVVENVMKETQWFRWHHLFPTRVHCACSVCNGE